MCNQPGTAGLINGDSFCLASSGSTQSIRRKSAIQSLIAGYILLGVGLLILSNGLWNPAKLFEKTQPTSTRWHKAPVRLVIVCLLGNGTVCIWHGIWYLLDYYILPDDPVKSYKITSGVGAAVCYLMCSGASMLAPPAIFLMDGPSHLPPPIGDTIITSYRSIAYPCAVAREKTKKDPLWTVFVDAIMSYLILPWGVVGFWRGMWMLMDEWLWGFTADKKDLHLSMLWSALLGLGALFVGSEDVVQHFDATKLQNALSVRVADGVFGRIRTIVLAFGAVNFWRAVWYTWDEFLGETHAWSAALAHVIGIIGLLCLGCVSCVTAPPSTLGVDAVAHPDCADEPLFHNVPLPSEAICILAIARRPELLLKTLSADPSIISDPSALSDRVLLSDVTRRAALDIPPEVFRCIDDLLVEDDSIHERARSTVRFTEQSASHVQSSSRAQSSSAVRLTKRHQMKRQKSQFFRNR